MVNSGSSANLCLIQSLLNVGYIKKNDIVGVSSLTWSTNIMPLIQLGLQVKLIDCEIETLNISVNQIKKSINQNEKLSMLFITNTLGLCDELNKIAEFCEKNKIILIEDNCEALGSVYNKTLLGNFGLASTFSFFVGHHLSTIEGGMICTNDKDLHNELLMARAHGWDRNLPELEKNQIRNKHKINEFYSKYTFYDLAFNIRPTEINGFIGNIQIDFLDEIVKKREKNFIQVSEEIEKQYDLIPVKYNHMDVLSSFAIPIICKSSDVLNTYINKFKKNNIEIRPMIAGNMKDQPFFKKYTKCDNDLKNSNFVHHNSFYCGNNPDMTKDDIALIKETIKGN